MLNSFYYVLRNLSPDSRNYIDPLKKTKKVYSLHVKRKASYRGSFFYGEFLEFNMKTFKVLGFWFEE